jgi:hypothetical protein
LAEAILILGIPILSLISFIDLSRSVCVKVPSSALASARISRASAKQKTGKSLFDRLIPSNAGSVTDFIY